MNRASTAVGPGKPDMNRPSEEKKVRREGLGQRKEIDRLCNPKDCDREGPWRKKKANPSSSKKNDKTTKGGTIPKRGYGEHPQQQPQEKRGTSPPNQYFHSLIPSPRPKGNPFVQEPLPLCDVRKIRSNTKGGARHHYKASGGGGTSICRGKKPPAGGEKEVLMPRGHPSATLGVARTATSDGGGRNL